ncbi:hypothetical protein ACLB90_10270 [Stenotrophomonas sp. LGBM10]|uniref:hypothetical protein n=1 Tax=Stenotrophomonas sp. LGBM10 TaxID=3390038 RepID=UPI00398B1EFA
MNPLSSAATPAPAAAVDRATRLRTLAGVLRQAPQSDAELLLAGLARMLEAHMGRDHDDAVSNARIRAQLDNIQLLLALEIERAGIDPQAARAA